MNNLEHKLEALTKLFTFVFGLAQISTFTHDFYSAPQNVDFLLLVGRVLVILMFYLFLWLEYRQTTVMPKKRKVAYFIICLLSAFILPIELTHLYGGGVIHQTGLVRYIGALGLVYSFCIMYYGLSALWESRDERIN